MVKTFFGICVAPLLAVTLLAQDLPPELAESAAKYKAATEALEKQRLAAAAQAAQPYVATLDGIGKAATAKGDVKTAEAATKEREAALAGALPAELPAGLPALRLQGTRKALLMKLEPITSDFGKRKKRLDGEYLGFLDALKQKADPESALAKRIAAEKETLLADEKGSAGKPGDEKKEAKVSRGKNVVVNGDFEKADADGKPEGWKIDWGWKDRVSLVTEKGNSFIRFDEIVDNKDGSSSLHMFTQNIEFPRKAERATVSARLRTENVVCPNKENFPSVMVTFCDQANKKRCCPAFWGGKNGSWKTIQADVSIPVGVVSAEIAVMNGYCPGRMDFDDIEVSFK